MVGNMFFDNASDRYYYIYYIFDYKITNYKLSFRKKEA